MKELFTVGQEVICTVTNFRTWSLREHREVPSKTSLQSNVIYTVQNSNAYHLNSRIYIELKEFGENELFAQDIFAPVMPQETLEENLSEIFHQPITII